MVTIGFNGKMNVADAADYLRCSPQSVMAYIKKNKLKAQKIEKKWMIERDEVEHAKSTHLIKARLKKAKKMKKMESEEAPVKRKYKTRGESKTVTVTLEIDREDFHMISILLKGSGGVTIHQFLEHKIKEVAVRVGESLKSIQI